MTTPIKILVDFRRRGAVQLNGTASNPSKTVESPVESRHWNSAISAGADEAERLLVVAALRRYSIDSTSLGTRTRRVFWKRKSFVLLFVSLSS